MKRNVDDLLRNLMFGFNLLRDLNVQTWMYIAVPVLLYCGERTLRAFRAGNYTVNIVKVMRFLLQICNFLVLSVS